MAMLKLMELDFRLLKRVLVW